MIEWIGDCVLYLSFSAGPLILSEVGDVYSFGDGSTGQLGLGPPSLMTTPHIVDLLPRGKIYMVATGYGHSVAVTGACLLLDTDRYDRRS